MRLDMLRMCERHMCERRERPSWGLASLLRPARAAPCVPFVGVATALKPERMHQRSTWHDLRWLHATTLRIDIASLSRTQREILIKVNVVRVPRHGGPARRGSLRSFFLIGFPSVGERRGVVRRPEPIAAARSPYVTRVKKVEYETRQAGRPGRRA